MLRIVGLVQNLKANKVALIYKFLITVIQSNPQWEYAGVYFDYGSGLRQNGRSNLEDMLNKACAGEIDYILTKSLSRLSRNVLDTLIIIRKLKERGINMYFENENLNSIED